MSNSLDKTINENKNANLNTAKTNNNSTTIIDKDKSINIDKQKNKDTDNIQILSDLKNNSKDKFLSSLVKSFLKDDEYSEAKENLIILLESVKKSQMRSVLITFFTYNSIKYVLWNYGYFALFFYYTRMMSVVLAGIGCYLVDYNFKLKIEKYGLKGYYNKMKDDSNKRKISRINEAVKRDLLLEKDLLNKH